MQNKEILNKRLGLAMLKQFAVYIVTNKKCGIPYIGVTSDLPHRAYEHSNSLYEGFSKKYGLKIPVYYEFHETALEAIAREKKLKSWKREWKIRLIESMNPEWRDLTVDFNN